MIVFLTTTYVERRRGPAPSVLPTWGGATNVFERLLELCFDPDVVLQLAAQLFQVLLLLQNLGFQVLHLLRLCRQNFLQQGLSRKCPSAQVEGSYLVSAQITAFFCFMDHDGAVVVWQGMYVHEWIDFMHTPNCSHGDVWSMEQKPRNHSGLHNIHTDIHEATTTTTTNNKQKEQTKPAKTLTHQFPLCDFNAFCLCLGLVLELQ